MRCDGSAPSFAEPCSAGVTVHVPSQHTAHQVRELLGAERIAVVPLGSPTVLPPGAPVHLAGLDGRPYVLASGPRSRGRTCPG